MFQINKPLKIGLGFCCQLITITFSMNIFSITNGFKTHIQKLFFDMSLIKSLELKRNSHEICNFVVYKIQREFITVILEEKKLIKGTLQ